MREVGSRAKKGLCLASLFVFAWGCESLWGGYAVSNDACTQPNCAGPENDADGSAGEMLDLSVSPQDLAGADLSGADLLAPSQTVVAVGAGGIVLRKYPQSIGFSPETSGVSESLTRVHGASANSLFAVGAGGTVIRHDGTSWKVAATITKTSFSAVYVRNSSSAWVGGDTGILYRWNGSTFSSMNMVGMGSISGILGFSSGPDVFAITSGVAGDGTVYTKFLVSPDGTTLPLGSNVSPTGIYKKMAGVNGSNLYVAGGAKVIKYDGSKWTQVGTVPLMTRLNSVWCDGVRHVWVAGTGGLVLRQDFVAGTAWQDMNSPATEDLQDVYGTGPNDVWFVGTNGTVLHYTTSFAVVSSGSSVNLLGVWAGN
ncbi:MAG TPA: hypothetical protein PKE31_17775 [Pseudomonadota bacterium]|nr:hypothetical protein [Pseudomonadota bacterium]